MGLHKNDRLADFLGPGAVSSLLVAAGVGVAGLGVPIALRLREVLGTAARDEREESDVIVVVGRMLKADKPTRVFAARLEHGAELLRAGLAPRLLVAGGMTGDATRTEAAAGRDHLLTLGVPADRILCEDRSRHTLENLAYVRDWLRENGLRRILAVSDPLHLARVAALARGFGLHVRCSPARAAAPHGWRYWARALREAHLLHWYHSGVAYSRLVRNQRYLARVT